MKNGDYIRTDIGEIRKVVRVTDDLYILDKDVVFAHKDKIKKSSSDILDLLKPMDLLYINIENGCAGGIIVPRIPETYCELKQMINEIKLGNYILKGVVTKEQLENCMYKVGE